MDQDRRAAGDKPGLPEVFRKLGEKAIARHQKRQATPELEIHAKDQGWWVGSPYCEDDENHWTALLYEAFGTRSGATFTTFVSQLAGLCSRRWNETANAWHPDEDDLIAAIQIVRSTKPRTEAEACLAAQMVAVHRMQMQLSAQAIQHSWPEPRTCAIAGKLARTYAMQLETMAKLKGRGSRQQITVRKYSQHEHKHIHLHPGGSENGNQPHGPRDTETGTALQSPSGTSLPRTDTVRNALPVSSREREESLSAARGCARSRRAEGQT